MKQLTIALLILLPFRVFAFGTDPFQAEAVADSSQGEPRVVVRLTVPPNHILYAHELKISSSNAVLVSIAAPQPTRILDRFTHEEKDVFNASVEFVYSVAEPRPAELQLRVAYQGCDEQVCFFPQKKNFTLALGPAPAAEKVPTIGTLPEKSSNDWKFLLASYREPRTAAGYLGRDAFLAFLGGTGNTALADFERRGWALTLLLLIAGGVALNLTPCVLPLIPINLAILGAGAKARSKAQGFALGAAYGLAMALVYGVLGLLVVFTGAKFGALNASLGFNVAIAILFVVMALAMFDLIAIDLSRFQGTAARQDRVGLARYAGAFTMGAVAALLAGACVAPVLISTLLLAGNLYAQGNTFAALMPFLLGLGMGLPWPFAGAGLSFLPKPGAWMKWVKYVFGIIILGLAVYYGKLAWDIHRLRAGGGTDADPAVASLEKLNVALRGGRPVFIDFWATWCKNCHAMDATTFKDAEVRAQLGRFEVVKFQAEFPDQSPAKDVLDQFHAVGLPTYAILEPR